MNTFKKLNKNYLFEKNNGIKKQHKKILEEYEEVVCEVKYDDNEFKIKDINLYINELLDLRMAINNQIVKMANEFGEDKVKSACDSWDNKMEEYKNKKYKEVI